MKGKLRNKPCWCGSERKLKNCHKEIQTSSQVKEDRLRRTVYKGCVEMKVMIGNLILRSEYNVVKPSYLNPTHKDFSTEGMKGTIETITELQEIIDYFCVYQGFYMTNTLKEDLSTPLMVKSFKDQFGIQFDMERWIKDVDYYFHIFHNHRGIHDTIVYTGEKRNDEFHDGMILIIRETIETLKLHEKVFEDKRENYDLFREVENRSLEMDMKIGKFMKEPFEYWDEKMKGLSDEEIDTRFKNMKSVLQPNSTYYTTLH